MKTTPQRAGQLLAIGLLLNATQGLLAQELTQRFEFDRDGSNSVRGGFDLILSTDGTHTEAPVFNRDTPDGTVAGVPTHSIEFGRNNQSGGLKSFATLSPDAYGGNGALSVWFKSTQNDSRRRLFQGANGGFAVSTISNFGPYGDIEGVAVSSGGTFLPGGVLEAPLNKWNHLVLTWDTNATTLTVFVNGQIRSTTAALDVIGDSFLRIGTFADSDNEKHVDLNFIGSLYDLQIYDAEMDATQAGFLFDNPGSMLPEH